jgi:hypothetical protein
MGINYFLNVVNKIFVKILQLRFQFHGGGGCKTNCLLASLIHPRQCVVYVRHLGLALETNSLFTTKKMSFTTKKIANDFLKLQMTFFLAMLVKRSNQIFVFLKLNLNKKI